MEVYVGTSGWMYEWNPKRNFEWFIKNSGLNAAELNVSFYRFPFPSQVKGWAQRGKALRWAIKVNRLITHTFKFNQRAFKLWKRFENLFKPLDACIDFYLFQLPPQMKSSFAPKLQQFIEKTKLRQRFALEVRNLDWFEEKWIGWASELGITWVSVDAPDFTNFPREVYNTSGLVYLRMHGRYAWYSHYYTDEELEEVAEKIMEVKPKKVYVMLNNNHAMLSNARSMKRILERLIKNQS